jgi:2,4-dienoyl-CoA reductase-like NADH-dependent reductase (Old Yellow Enzyme family)
MTEMSGYRNRFASNAGRERRATGRPLHAWIIAAAQSICNLYRGAISSRLRCPIHCAGNRVDVGDPGMEDVRAAGTEDDRPEVAVAEGICDAVAFGRPYISNADLVERFRLGAPLDKWDAGTFYQGGDKGYLDYPTLDR